MAEDLSIEVRNLREVVNYLNAMPVETFGQAKTVFRQVVIRTDKQIKDNATNILKVRTGNLKRSFMFDVAGTNVHNLRARVYSASVVGGKPVIYAPIHEYGGTINAKNAYKGVPGGPYLNIPGQQNKTPAGATRMNAREVFNAGGFIMGRTVMRGGPNEMRMYDVMFFLVKSVEIKPRLGMLKAAEDEIPTILSDLQAIIGT